MSIRPEQPEPFLRGCVFPAVTDAPYPRADPANAEYLPADVWDAAQLPVGVRLEMSGNARTIRVWYKTTRASLGYRGESAGCTFVAYRAGQKVAVADAVMGEGMAELELAGRTDTAVTIYLPEGMAPLVTGVAGVDEVMSPAPLQPRWLAYGDAVTQGWLASAPAMAWPAVAGRKLGLDVCNLGYAGTARGETTSALMLAETPAEVISIAFGLNNWSRVPHTTGLMTEEVRCFLSVVRAGHPEVPIVVVSPTARPDAEDTPNRVGATLAQLRQAMEDTVRAAMAAGDEKLFLVEGLHAVHFEDLEDGMYPGDEGHRRLAAAVTKILVPHLADLQATAEKRWAAEGTSPIPAPSGASVPPALVPGTPVGPSPHLSTAPPPPAAASPASPAADGDLDALDGVTATDILDVISLTDTPDALSGAAAGSHDGDARTDRSPNGVAPSNTDTDPADPVESTKAVRRDTTPADIEIADMVVAALTLATNGADDIIVARDEIPTYELAWPEDVSVEDLQWPEDVSPEDLQWQAAPALDGEQWADAAEPAPTDDLQWTDPDLQWTDPDLQWTDPSATDDRQWAEAVPAVDDQLPWAEAVPAVDDQLQWVEPVPTGGAAGDDAPGTTQYATAEYATGDYATDEYGIDEYATDGFVTPEYVTDQFASDALEWSGAVEPSAS